MTQRRGLGRPLISPRGGLPGALVAARLSGGTVACLGFLSACRAPARATPFDFATKVGVAVRQGDRTCLTIEQPALDTAERVALVPTDAPAPDAFMPAAIVRRSDRPCLADAALDPAAAPAAYEVRLVRGALTEAAPAFAVVVGPHVTFTRGADGVTADLDGDGRSETFRSCTSAEGLHLTIWAGRPLVGARRWHRYAPLGYDVEATCTPAEVAPGDGAPAAP